MFLNQLLSIARQRGVRISAVDKAGQTVHVLEYLAGSSTLTVPAVEEAMVGFYPATVVDAAGEKTQYVTDVMLPVASLDLLKTVETAHALDCGLRTLKPHLPDMLEAFPHLKIYAARSLELLDPNQAAIVASYGQYDHPDTELNILKGFGAMGCLSYAEVEKWRYKEIPIPQ